MASSSNFRNRLAVAFGFAVTLLSGAAAHAQNTDFTDVHVGDILNVRIDDEYYAYYTSAGGIFTPTGNATVDPGDPHLFHMPVTRGSDSPDSYQATGSGIHLKLGNLDGDFENWGSVDHGLDPLGVVMPNDGDGVTMDPFARFLWLNLLLARPEPGVLPLVSDSASSDQTATDFLDAVYSTAFPLAISGDFSIIDAANTTLAGGGEWNFFEVTHTAVPEPGAASLLLVVGIAATRRVRRVEGHYSSAV